MAKYKASRSSYKAFNWKQYPCRDEQIVKSSFHFTSKAASAAGKARSLFYKKDEPDVPSWYEVDKVNDRLRHKVYKRR